MPCRLLSVIALLFLIAVAPVVLAQPGDLGLDAVKEFLRKTHAKKKWQTGPQRITSDALVKAYGGEQRFYYVFSAPPLPPGANIPEAIKAYEDRRQDYLANFISATVRVDSAGKVIPLMKPADYNTGLMAVTTAEDAKIAAAAVLSLYGSGQVAPGVVKAAEVNVTNNGQAWQGVVERKNEFQGAVDFTNKGQVSRLSKVYTGPVPP